jgi:hypothetical protein
MPWPAVPSLSVKFSPGSGEAQAMCCPAGCLVSFIRRAAPRGIPEPTPACSGRGAASVGRRSGRGCRCYQGIGGGALLSTSQAMV